MTIFRNGLDGSRESVFEYGRNYSMMKTFEPFRQYKDGIWHDYALISTKYTRFEVVDLEKGVICAVEEYPKVDEQMLGRMSEASKGPGGWAENMKIGDELPSSGFCPTEFRVFDWNEQFSESSMNEVFKSNKPDVEDRFLFTEEQLHAYTGQWAIYAGCVWGDDSSMKIKYIDLSRISEGIVVSDERFGYVELATSLKDVEYSDESDMFEFPTILRTSRVTGKSYPLDAKFSDSPWEG